MGQSIFGITPAVGFVADVSTTWIVFKAIQLGGPTLYEYVGIRI